MPFQRLSQHTEENDSLITELAVSNETVIKLQNELDTASGELKALHDERKLFRSHLESAENSKQAYQAEVRAVILAC